MVGLGLTYRVTLIVVYKLITMININNHFLYITCNKKHYDILYKIGEGVT